MGSDLYLPSHIGARGENEESLLFTLVFIELKITVLKTHLP